MSKPIAVIISDCHYNLQTLEIADLAMRQAILRANSLNVTLIIAGDLTDNKANMRAEVVNQMLETFKLPNIKPYLLVGNHDKVNEKSDDHALNFLSQLVHLVDSFWRDGDLTLIPYQHDPEYLRTFFRGKNNYKFVIMHQGITGSNSGDYFQDKSAITPNDVAGLRIVSGHYHQRQDIQLPDGGLWSYVGNPYTLNFGEANDPDKGFRILNSDGTLDFVPTNLRKHVILDISLDDKLVIPVKSPQDLGLARIRGTKQQLATFNPDMFEGWKLELIPTEITVQSVNQHQSQPEIIDGLIDTLETDLDQKSRLKLLWKGL